MKKILSFTVVYLIVVLLSACGSTTQQTPGNPDTSGDAARIISADVADFKGQANLTVKAEDLETAAVLATGTIDVEGKVSITLPTTVGAALLEPFEANEGCSFSPASSAQAYFVEALAIYANNEAAGLITQQNGTSSIVRVFVTEDANIVCSNAAENAAFKSGWNLVSFDNATGIGQVVASSTAAWSFSGELPKPTDPTEPTDPTDPIDTTPPTVESSTSTSNTTVELVFSEAIEGGDNAAAYTIITADASLAPLTVTAASVSTDKTTVTLTTESQKAISYGFTAIALKDAAGNDVDLTASGSNNINFFGTPLATGDLAVSISGLPSGVAASIEVTGPDSFSQTLTTSETLTGLKSGTYSFSIAEVTPDSATYSDAASPRSIVFDATVGASVALNYACSAVNPPDSGLDTALKTATFKDSYNCADLEGLTVLFAIGQSISNLEGLQYAKNLQVLNLTNNALTTIPQAIISELSNLTQLQLQSNQLTTLSAGSFTNLTKLEELFLFNNDISSVSATTFTSLTALRNLQLQTNELSSLSATMFSGLTNLEELYLFSNNIATLPYGVFAGLTSLTRLDLQDNCLTPKAIPTEGIIAEATTVTTLTTSEPKAGCAANTLPEWKAFTGTSGLAVAGSYVHPTVAPASNPVPLALCRGSYDGGVFIGEAYFVTGDPLNQQCRMVTFDGQVTASTTEMLYGTAANLVWRDVTDQTYVAEQAAYAGKRSDGVPLSACSAAHAGGRHLGFVLPQDSKCYIGYNDGNAATADILSATSYRVLVDTNK